MNATCLCKVYSKPSDGLVLGQRQRRLSGIEQAIDCDSDPALYRNLVGRPTSSVPGTRYIMCKQSRQVLNECWPAPAMVVEGINVKDIFELSPWFVP